MEPAKPVDLVLSGGGVKFIGLVGAIVALMDAGYSIKRVSGVSAGSVVAAILAAGCHAAELTGAQVRNSPSPSRCTNGATPGRCPTWVRRGGRRGTPACTAATSRTTGFAAS